MEQALENLQAITEESEENKREQWWLNSDHKVQVLHLESGLSEVTMHLDGILVIDLLLEHPPSYEWICTGEAYL